MSTNRIGQMPLSEALAPDMIGETGLLFLDFDHTLFGCNSTELFIGSCKPAAIVALIDFLIRVCIPWKLTRLDRWYRVRDYVCIIAILILTPWNAKRWKRIAPGFFSKYENYTLTQLLGSAPKQRIVIVSFGMAFIIRSLLAESRFSCVSLLATPIASRPTSFRRGKLFHVQQYFDAEVIAASTLITDSSDDSDLMAKVARPSLIKPYGVTYRAAQHLYIPLRYTVSAKYSFFYTIDQLLFVDFPIAVIAVSGSVTAFLHTIVVMPFFVMALMCIYEIGYFENDMRAAKLEPNPTLSGKERAFAHYPIRTSAWVWSLALSGVGVFIGVRTGALTQSSAVGSYCFWSATLVLLQLAFFCYNRISVLTRIYVYPLLQLLKYGAIVVVFKPTSTGAMLILAQILTMYVIYVVYRLNGDRQAFPKEQGRLIMFVLTVAALLAPRSYDPRSDTFSLAMAMAWLIFRIARTALVKLYKHRRLISLEPNSI